MSNASENYTGLEIAVIGLSGRFPGANDVHALWELLRSGREGLSFFNEQELKEAGVEEELLRHPNYVSSRGVLDKVEYFDNAFFGFSARESALLDPQVRILLECTYEALEDAGYNPFSYPKKIGLFAGANPNLYWSLGTYLSGVEDIGDFANKDLLSTRISYKLNLKGPSHTLFTACSTSLVAVHQACRSLLGGECDMALAGGVSIQLPQTSGYIHQEGMILSTDGHNRSFDEDASGTVFSNGAGIVLLKPLEDALQDGDHIYAVIKGSAVNNDGNRKVGFPAPSVKGQAEVIREALQVAQVDPASLSFVEAHGSATAIGDPIEVEALTQAFGLSGKQVCGIGSVKSNLGHLNIASGVAGLIKAVLSLHNRMLPPSIHFQKPNPKIDFDSTPFYVVRELASLERSAMPLRAGVSSFGVGGTNAHVVLEEAPQPITGNNTSRPVLLLLSAHTAASLQGNRQALASFLETGNVSLRDAAYTLQVGRNSFAHRAMVVCNNAKEAALLLNDAGNAEANIVDENIESKIVFMFSGQGSQYVNMGRELYTNLPYFKDEMDKGLHIMNKYCDVDVRKIWLPGSDDEASLHHLIDHTQYTQPLLFIFEHALCRCMMKLGIQPDAMIGHSLGEYVAACISGVFSFEDALRLVIRRGKLIQSLEPGSMMAISITEAALLPLLSENISIAAVNSSRSCVVSGTSERIEQFKNFLESSGYSCRMLKTSHAFHSDMMEPVLDEFKEACSLIQTQEPAIPFISNRTGRFVTGKEVRSPEYWVAHLRDTVRFNDGIKELSAFPNCIFIEIGPGNTLSTLASQALTTRMDCSVVNLVRHPKENEPDESYLLKKLGSLWLKGTNIDWHEYYQNETRRRVSLPAYAFDRKPFWFDEDSFKKKTALLKNGSAVIALNSKLYKPAWISEPLRGDASHELNDAQCILFLDEYGIGTALLNEIKSRYAVPVITARMGSCFAKISEHEYVLNLTDHKEINDFLAEAIVKDKTNLHLIFCWYLQQPVGERKVDMSPTMVENTAEALTGFDNIIRSAAIVNGLTSIRTWYLTNDSSDIELNNGSNYANSFLYGASRAYSRKYDRIDFKRIEIEWDGNVHEVAPVKTLKRIAAEFLDGANHDFIFLKGNSRMVCKMDMEVKPVKVKDTRLHHKNIVVIGNVNSETLLASEYFLDKGNKLYAVSPGYFPEQETWADWTSENVPHYQLLDLFRSVEKNFSWDIDPVSLPEAIEEVNALPIAPVNDDAVLSDDAGQRFMHMLQQFSAALICSYFNECGIVLEKGKVYSDEAIHRKLGVLPSFAKFYRYFLHVLTEDGIIEQSNGRLKVLREIDAAGMIRNMHDQIAHHYPESLSLYNLITHCVAHYRKALSGEIAAISVLFPDGSSRLLDSVSKNSAIFPGTSMYTRKAKELVLNYINRYSGKRRIRILEVGAGRGELTQVIAPALKGRQVEYYYTDIGKTFVNDAKKNLEAEYPFMEFRQFDICSDPSAQGFEEHSFDMVLALDVVHATPSLEKTINNLQRMVIPGGWMFFIENTSALRLVNLVWGLADGWWNFEDDAIRKVTPLIPAEAWRSLLAGMDFSFAGTFPMQENGIFNDHELITIQTKPVHENNHFVDYLAARHAIQIRDIKTGIHSWKALNENRPAMQLVAAKRGMRLHELLPVINKDCGVIHEIVCFFESLQPVAGSELENYIGRLKALAAVHRFAEKNSVQRCVVFSSIDPYVTQTDNAFDAAVHAGILSLANLFNSTGDVSWMSIKAAHLSHFNNAQLHDKLKLSKQSWFDLLDQCFSLYENGELLVSSINPVELADAVVKTTGVAGDGKETRKLAEEEAGADDTEYRLCQIWNEVFGITNTTRTDNYFELGGDSLMMVAVLSKIEREFQVKIKINEFHNNITVAALAKLIASKQQDTHLVITKAAEKEYYPCTSVQKTMFYLQLLHPENTAYNITKVIELFEDVDEERLVSCVNQIIRRQENLRTIFRVINSEPSQKILDRFELKAEYMHATDNNIVQSVEAFIRPFDLTESPAIRIGFIRNAGALYMIIDIHHIICDGIAIDVLKKELANIYYGSPASALPIQYKDFSEWQNTTAFRHYLETQKGFWLNKFKTPVPKLNLPADFVRSRFDTPKGDHLVETVERDLAVSIKKLVKTTNSTLFGHLLAAAYVVLNKYSGVEDIVIGTGTKGRNFQNLDYIIGNFVNTVALRSFPAKEKSYIEFQEEVKQTISEALENQDYQYDELINQLPYNQGKEDKDLFSVAVTLVSDSLVDQEEDPSKRLFKKYVEYFDKTSKFDIDINAVEKGNDITIVIEYSSLLFKPSTIRAFYRHYLQVLEQVTAHPGILLKDIVLQVQQKSGNEGSKPLPFKSEILKESIKENFLNHKY